MTHLMVQVVEGTHPMIPGMVPMILLEEGGTLLGVEDGILLEVEGGILLEVEGGILLEAEDGTHREGTAQAPNSTYSTALEADLVSA